MSFNRKSEKQEQLRTRDQVNDQVIKSLHNLILMMLKVFDDVDLTSIAPYGSLSASFVSIFVSSKINKKTKNAISSIRKQLSIHDDNLFRKYYSLLNVLRNVSLIDGLEINFKERIESLLKHELSKQSEAEFNGNITVSMNTLSNALVYDSKSHELFTNKWKVCGHQAQYLIWQYFISEMNNEFDCDRGRRLLREITNRFNKLFGAVEDLALNKLELKQAQQIPETSEKIKSGNEIYVDILQFKSKEEAVKRLAAELDIWTFENLKKVIFDYLEYYANRYPDAKLTEIIDVATNIDAFFIKHMVQQVINRGYQLVQSSKKELRLFPKSVDSNELNMLTHAIKGKALKIQHEMIVRRNFTGEWKVGSEYDQYPAWYWLVINFDDFVTDHALDSLIAELKQRFGMGGYTEGLSVKFADESEIWNARNLIQLANGLLEAHQNRDVYSNEIVDKFIKPLISDIINPLRNQNQLPAMREEEIGLIEASIQLQAKEYASNLKSLDIDQDENSKSIRNLKEKISLLQEQIKHVQNKIPTNDAKQDEPSHSSSDLKETIESPQNQTNNSTAVSGSAVTSGAAEKRASSVNWRAVGIIAGFTILAAVTVVATVLSGPLAPAAAAVGAGVLGLLGVHVSAAVATLTGMSVLAFGASLVTGVLGGLTRFVKAKRDAKRAVVAKKQDQSVPHRTLESDIRRNSSTISIKDSVNSSKNGSKSENKTGYGDNDSKSATCTEKTALLSMRMSCNSANSTSFVGSIHSMYYPEKTNNSTSDKDNSHGRILKTQ